MNNIIPKRLRQGQSLLLVFFIIVALAGILALTLDFGFVLLARRQMQTGVNTAALEGWRNVDIDDDDVGDGKENARRLMRNVFDDDLDPTSNNTTVGAGLASTIVQGNGYRQTVLGNGQGARNLYVNRSQYIYRPDPQLNEADEPHGDFVFGHYDGEAVSHDEFSDYSRGDFEIDGSQDSFLARLRRTHNPNGLDDIPGVSSSGGGLPLLVGRLAWFSQQPAGAAYSIRRDGVTVRATAIADGKFAVRVWESSHPRVDGAIPFGISKADFMLQPNPESSVFETNTLLTQVGQTASLGTPGGYAGQVGYIAVIDEDLLVDAGQGRVIGFLRMPGTPAPNRQPNASGRLTDAWEFLGELAPAERDALFVSRTEADANSPHALLRVPALVRSVR